MEGSIILRRANNLAAVLRYSLIVSTLIERDNIVPPEAQ